MYYSMHLGRVFNALMVYYESEELLKFDSKSTFGRIQLHLILSKNIEAIFQVPNMLTHSLALHQHIVYIYFHGLPD